MCFVSHPKDSRSEPKSSKSFVSSRKVCFGKFRWTPRMPSWRNWSFTANQNFLGRTKEIYKIVFPSKEFFLKKFYWSRRFQFWQSCRKHLQTSGTSLFRISKQSQIYVFFRKKTFCLKVFPWTDGMLFWQICLKCFAKKTAFPYSLPKGRKILVSAESSSSKCSAGHVECLLRNLEFSCKSQFPRKNHEMI